MPVCKLGKLYNPIRIPFIEVVQMGYPVNLEEGENKQLKYPFLTVESYDGISQTPEGPAILLRNSEQEISLIEQRTIAQIMRKFAEKTADSRDTE